MIKRQYNEQIDELEKRVSKINKKCRVSTERHK